MEEEVLLVVEVKEKKAKKIVINAQWCKGCGVCIDMCPRGALTKDHKEKAVWEFPEKCVSCGLCELRCPDIAITMEEKE
jgi:2-oxoglutarate ferredoxin oxidoreductase subunit delta